MDPASTPRKERRRTSADNRFSLGRVLTIVIYVQYVVIILLLLALSSEYQSSPGFQAWIQANIAPLGPLLSYYIPVFLAILLMIGNIAYHNSFAKRTGLD